MVVLFGKLMTVDEVDAVDMPLLELVPIVIAVAVVVVTVPDVDDGVQPIPRPRAPVQSAVVDEDDDTEVEATEVVIGVPEVTGEVKGSWLEVVDDEVGRGQPIPMPSNPSHDDDGVVATELVAG